MNADDQIYLVRGGEVHALQAITMKPGESGQAPEQALQTLLERHPNIIPGKQIEPESDDPPRFVLLRRDMPAKVGSVGNLYVDQHGMLTVVQVRLFENPESRREMVGRIIENAAQAVEGWGNGRARAMAAEAWSKEGKALDRVLSEGFGDPHASESIWERVEANLSQGRLRLIIATHELSPDMRRMIEYLNKQLRSTQVLGLELSCYGSDTDALVCVPRLVGRSPAAPDLMDSSRAAWTVDSLREAYGRLPDPGMAQKLGIALDWALENGFFIESRGESPHFGFRGAVRNRLGSIHIDGNIYLYLREEFYRGGANGRDELLSHLVDLGMLPVGFDVNQVEQGRNLIRSLAEMSDSEFHDLLDVFTRHIRSAASMAGLTA